MAVRTFDSSAEVLGYLQQQYGSADYKSWQSLRQQFYSYVTYPLAGSARLTFFGAALGTAGTTTQLTNMPQAGQFGQQHFLLKSIRCKFFIQTWDLQVWAGLNANTLYSDLIDGLFQSGVLELNINARQYAQIPKPFLYAPPADGRAQVYSAGLGGTFTISSGVVTDLIWAPPYATLDSRRDAGYMVDPNILIEAAQNFEVVISWPTGLVPVIATTIVTAGNPLSVGVSLDGILFRPVQ